MKKILFFGNNKLGLQALKFLSDQSVEIVGAVLHPNDERKYGKKIISCLDDVPIFPGNQLNSPVLKKQIQAVSPDLGLSVLFGYIIPENIINIIPDGIINLHLGYLPYNRGAYPNVWSIVDGTPAGVSLHYIDEGIDTGDIISRREVEIEPVDTGKSLYEKLESEGLKLLKQTWSTLQTETTETVSQDLNEGTAHKKSEVEKIDEIDLDKEYTARELINRMRARTFPPHEGVFFKHNGRKINVRIELEYDNSEREGE